MFIYWIEITETREQEMISIQPQWEKQSVGELSRTLEGLYQLMMEHQHRTDYTSAEMYRGYHENCKKYILQRKLREADQNHSSNLASLGKSRASQLNACMAYWNDKFKEYNAECQELFRSLEVKYEQQSTSLRLQLEEELSPVVKQSNQLINLRRMEAHAAKQKNFVDAHSIQQKVKALYEKERVEWMEAKERTIQQSLKNLKAKQSKQSWGIQNRIKLALEDYEKEKFMQMQAINQKYDNSLKQLKATYERQILSLQGELKNLGGKSPTKKQDKDKDKDKQKPARIEGRPEVHSS